MDLGTRQVKEDFEDQVQDTEITLGTGKLLGIFFTVVIVCAVFFTMGYLLARAPPPVVGRKSWGAQPVLAAVRRANLPRLPKPLKSPRQLLCLSRRLGRQALPD